MSLSDEARRRAGAGLGQGGLFPSQTFKLENAKSQPSATQKNGKPPTPSTCRSKSTGRGTMAHQQQSERDKDGPTHIPFYVQNNRGVKAYSNGPLGVGRPSSRNYGSSSSTVPLLQHTHSNAGTGTPVGGVHAYVNMPKSPSSILDTLVKHPQSATMHGGDTHGSGFSSAQTQRTGRSQAKPAAPGTLQRSKSGQQSAAFATVGLSAGVGGAGVVAEADGNVMSQRLEHGSPANSTPGSTTTTTTTITSITATNSSSFEPPSLTLFDGRMLKNISSLAQAPLVLSSSNPAWVLDPYHAPVENPHFLNINSATATALQKPPNAVVSSRESGEEAESSGETSSTTTTTDVGDDIGEEEEEAQGQYHRHSGEGFSQAEWYTSTTPPAEKTLGPAPIFEPPSGSSARAYVNLADMVASRASMKAGVSARGAEVSSVPFWGGENLSVQLPSRPTSQRASRPGTASSYWSNYDLDEGALTAINNNTSSLRKHSGSSAYRQPSGSAAPLRPSSLILRTYPVSGRSSPCPSSSGQGSPMPQASSAACSPSWAKNGFNQFRPTGRPPSAVKLKRAEANTWAPHPSVIMDPKLMTVAPKGKIIDEVPVDEKGRPYPYVQPPVFPNTYPTIAFSGTAESSQTSGLHPLMRVKMRVRYAGIANSPVKVAFKLANFRVANVKAKEWNVNWGNIFTPAEFAAMHEFQRTNHFPGTWELGRKDYLYRNMYNAARRIKGGDAFDVVPRFFVLPRDYDEFKVDLERNPGRMYIQKPTNSSRGRGIKMVVKPHDLPRDTKDVLIQHYIHNPYTINGFKFDMRIYVAATCFDPLRLYVYPDGLARFAAMQYSQDKSDLKKRCVHLTNYSVNKKSDNAAVFANGLGGVLDADHTAVSKWSLAALRGHIEAEGRVKWEPIWKQVHDIIAKAVLSAEPRINTELKMKVPFRSNCFEIWGFDILLDQNFRAWLIEVNTCPSLAADSQLDRRVKSEMVADCLHMLGVTPYRTDEYEAEKEARKQGRLTGLGPKDPNKGKGPKTLKDAEALDFSDLLPEELPECIAETEAEFIRRRGWERVFPCVEDPSRYLDLFETPRSSNIMVCNYYARKIPKTNKARSAAPKSAARRKVEAREWRPGGG